MEFEYEQLHRLRCALPILHGDAERLGDIVVQIGV